MSSTDHSDDHDSNSIIRDTEKKQNKTSVVELLDELISHMNSTRSVFKIMILSSFILAPLSLMLATVFVIHPFFMHRILFRFPDIGIFLLFFIGVSIMLASMWLFIGLSEQKFFSDWDRKFKRYTSLKNQLDKELEG
ncbi:hypothetical protein [Nitrososphaera sp. AFS]|jgi:hypothetical protein|uniref:hypothetical protein n=1 Tax=Nitrososphaera sp. AFS TaxID=2301191 RepID=UPI0013922386|nr:hypothetical protein [Nitrososphaera sp. AFS]NAL78796.1 hypothetical protein [Nitrososphaera sp. AFS]